MVRLLALMRSVRETVIPAQAGIHHSVHFWGATPRLRGNDDTGFTAKSGLCLNPFPFAVVMTVGYRLVFRDGAPGVRSRSLPRQGDKITQTEMLEEVTFAARAAREPRLVVNPGAVKALRADILIPAVRLHGFLLDY
jgi:hypothetical protein